MSRPIVVLLYSISTILSAHAMVYLLVGVLPSAAVSALGLFSANEELLTAFAQSYFRRSYWEALGGVFIGDLGRTLDGQNVTFELTQAMMDSAPRLGLTLLLLVTICLFTSLWIRRESSGLQKIGDFLAFLPPYVAPFLGLAAILGYQFSTGMPLSAVALEIISILSLGIGSGALLAAQTARITQRNLRSDFARSIVAAGATPLQLRLKILHNLVVEIAPSFEKMMVAITAALFFTEPILGLDGFGVLATRAVRRSDIDLLLGVTLVIASIVALSRLLVWGVRVSYGVEE